MQPLPSRSRNSSPVSQAHSKGGTTRTCGGGWIGDDGRCYEELPTQQDPRPPWRTELLCTRSIYGRRAGRVMGQVLVGSSGWWEQTYFPECTPLTA